MAKDTIEIVNELNLCDDFKTFYNENQDNMINQNLPQILEELLEKKKLKKSEVIKASELAEIYAYQIFSGARTPERKKLLCLSRGFCLNLDETQTLLKTAGYTQLYVKVPFDSIVMYGICKDMTVPQINQILFEYELETLG